MITGPTSEIDERGGEQNRTYNFYLRVVRGRIKWGKYRIWGWKIPYLKSLCICLPQTNKAEPLLTLPRSLKIKYFTF